MPWQEMSIMSSRAEFVVLAQVPGTNIRQLCRRFGISSRTAYKWLARYAQAGADGLQDQSRRPRRSPRQTPPAVEAHVQAVRIAHPTWGGRKIHHYLRAHGVEGVPSASTITAIVRRQGLLPTDAPAAPAAGRRFEADAPNHLWQMDFKSPLRLPDGVCNPLTVLDDHSRYALGLQACADQTGQTVQTQLIQVVYPLWATLCVVSRQRDALVRPTARLPVDAVGLADASRHPRLSCPALPSPNLRQGRTVPPYAANRPVALCRLPR